MGWCSEKRVGQGHMLGIERHVIGGCGGGLGAVLALPLRVALTGVRFLLVFNLLF